MCIKELYNIKNYEKNPGAIFEPKTLSKNKIK